MGWTGRSGIRITLAHVKLFCRATVVITGVFVLTVLSAYGALSLMTELYEVRRRRSSSASCETRRQRPVTQS